MPQSGTNAALPPPVLIIPGWRDSGPDHWQTLWLQYNPGFVKVQQDDWEHPRVDEWTGELAAAVASFGRPPVLVAHSLGCALVAHWAAQHPHQARTAVTAALLVGPADADSPEHTPDQLRAFAPIPRDQLPFPSILVASRTDAYVSFERSAQLAAAWGSQLVDAGDAGHINVDSGHGAWPEGAELLTALRAAPYQSSECSPD